MQNNQQDKKVFAESDASIKARTTKLDNKLDVEQWREEAKAYLRDNRYAGVINSGAIEAAYLAGRKATALQLQRANESKRGIAERLLINLGENVQHYKHQGLSEEYLQHVFEAFAEATALDKQKVASEAWNECALSYQIHTHEYEEIDYSSIAEDRDTYLNSLNKPD